VDLRDKRHRQHRCYKLVVRHQGVIKVLIVDRGRIDGQRMGDLQQKWSIDTIIPLRTNMDLYANAIGLTRLRGFAFCSAGCIATGRDGITATGWSGEGGRQTPADSGAAQGRCCLCACFSSCPDTGSGNSARHRPRSAQLESMSGAVNRGGKPRDGRTRRDQGLGSGQHCRSLLRRTDSFYR